MKFLVLLGFGVLVMAASNFKDTIPAKIDSTQQQQQLTIETPKTDTTKVEKTNATISGIASFYSDYFEGRKTSNGETFRQNGYTCASNNIALGTWIKVTNLSNSKSIVVKVNDRMAPSMAKKGRVVDMTRLGAETLGFVSKGITKVKVEILGKKKPASIK